MGEAIFRGAKTRSKPVHPLLLPRALDDVAVNPTDPSKRRILEGSLGAFLAAVEDLSAYSHLSCLSTWAEKGNSIMDWLRLTPDNPLTSDFPQGYDIFRESLDPDRKWSLDFNAAFHPSLAELKKMLDSRAENLKKASQNEYVELFWSMSVDDEQCRILTHVGNFVECIVNLALNPIRESSCGEQVNTEIKISRSPTGLNEIRGTICLTILTQFQTFQTASEYICDQIETWDRERHDNTYRHDLPERAELSYFKIDDNNGQPHVAIAIDYIAPAHLEKSPEIFERIKDDLDRILAEHPKSALEKLSDEWPFNLDVSCTMSGVAMNTKISLPRNRAGLQKP